MQKVLIIDDDRELCRLLEKFLARENFVCETVHDGENGCRRALTGEHEIVVLDVMLPKMGGFDVLRKIRSESKVSVVMLTARAEDLDRIIGLEIGADDYLAKPFNPRELLARIKAIMRRTEFAFAEATRGNFEKIQIGDLEVESGSRTVRQNGEIVDLTTAEFDILLKLIQSAGAIVSREEIAETVLERRLAPFDRSVDMLISKIRRKLGNRLDSIERIRTVRNAGYVYAILPDQ